MLTNGIGSNTLRAGFLRADGAANKTIQRVADGKKVDRTNEISSESEILSTFDVESRSYAQAMSEQQGQVSVLQTASESLTASADILQNLSSLTAKATSGSLSDEDRTAIQQQISQLSSRIDISASQSIFNGQNLLDGTFSTLLQNGQRFAIDAMTTKGLGLSGISVASQSDAMSAMDSVKSAMDKVLFTQNGLNTALEGIGSSIAELQNQQMNSLSARSQISDVDMASEVLSRTLGQMQSANGFSVFNMSESTRSNIMNLLAE